MVNYHAIGEYVSRSRGISCQVTHYQNNIQVLAYILGNIPQQAQETQLAFAEAVGWGGPDDFHALQSLIALQYASMSLADLLSFLRLSGWDATVFADCLPYFLVQVSKADPIWYGDIANALHNILQHYLPLSVPDALVIQIEQILNEIGAE